MYKHESTEISGQVAQAFEDVNRAYEHRRQVVCEARDRGVTLREIADAAGVSISAVQKICGARNPRPNGRRNFGPKPTEAEAISATQNRQWERV